MPNDNHQTKKACSVYFQLQVCLIALLLAAGGCRTSHGPQPRPAVPLTVSWTNNILHLSGQNLPGGGINIWYLEAFCRSGAHAQDWRQTVIPHRTRLVSASPDSRRLDFITTAGDVEVRHSVQTTDDEVDMKFTLTNHGKDAIDLQWFEPACIRLAEFTGLDQEHFISKSFIFTVNGLTTLDQARRTEKALYKGGQVYLPSTTLDRDGNPRPLSLDRPVNGLIGCFSADNEWILATASSKTHELFEGVYVCLHSDPAVNGLRPQETKTIRSKIYLVRNNTRALLKLYHRDFPKEE